MYRNYRIEERDSTVPYKNFLNKYHYLTSLPRGCSKVFALIVDEIVVGVACYGHPVGRLAIGTIELKRFCLDNNRLPNTGSWFMSKCEKLLKKDKSIHTIVSYCDPSQGHTGGLYRACNFTYIGTQKQGTPYFMVKGKVIYYRNKNNHQGINLKKLKRAEPKMIFSKKIA